MGIIEIDQQKAHITIVSNLFFYGNGISEEIRKNAEDEINDMWNAPRALLWLNDYPYLVCFNTKVFLFPDLTPADILANKNPRNNYVRVEEFAYGNISFVDGLHSNTGYFKVENLYKGSTTVAHEYGHTIGLPHPSDLDLRGHGQPGIMYPRGTLVNPEYQYDPTKQAGEAGGTMHPKFRKVYQEDINDLGLGHLIKKKVHVIGKFSNRYHHAHLNNDRPANAPAWA